MIRVWFSSGQYVCSSKEDTLDAVAEALALTCVHGRVLAVTHDEDWQVTAKALGFR